LTVTPRLSVGQRPVDNATRWVEARMLTNKRASTIVSFLEDLFSRFGRPASIMYDQGMEFKNAELKAEGFPF